MTDASKRRQRRIHRRQMAAMQRIAREEPARGGAVAEQGGGRRRRCRWAQGLANDFLALAQQLLANPMALVETQAQFWQDYLTLWQRTTQRMLG